MFSRIFTPVLIFLCSSLYGTDLMAQVGSAPTTWVDKDTGHRIWQLTPGEHSTSLYFTKNAFTPDGKAMVYTASDGVRILDLASRQTRLLLPNRDSKTLLRPIEIARRTNTLYLLVGSASAKNNKIVSVNLDAGTATDLFEIPKNYTVESINADETFAVGTFEETKQPMPRAKSTDEQVPLKKGVVIGQRFASRTSMTLFVVNLKDGAISPVLQSTDWISHPQFSPVDPGLLMYCHEGPWQQVDRIWTIRTDGTRKTLIHKRTMAMEIAGHEFWAADGKTVWYDWQFPKGESFYLASVDTDTKSRKAYHVERNDWSIHFNATLDQTLFVGDGADKSQVSRADDGRWIVLLEPRLKNASGFTSAPDFIQGGVLKSERLVNMKAHDYRLEPNVRISPDKSIVIFRSNMFGKQSLFGVEVRKSRPDETDVFSTPALSEKYKLKRKALIID